jgi:hypothetical protein
MNRQVADQLVGAPTHLLARGREALFSDLPRGWGAVGSSALSTFNVRMPRKKFRKPGTRRS